MGYYIKRQLFWFYPLFTSYKIDISNKSLIKYTLILLNFVSAKTLIDYIDIIITITFCPFLKASHLPFYYYWIITTLLLIRPFLF